MIILDSSPLLHLTKLGKLPHVINKEKKLLIPPAVFQEVIVRGKEEKYAEAFIIENYLKSDKIEVKKSPPPKESLLPLLGKGELQALALAQKENLPLIIDDKKARNVAQLLNLNFQTTIATLFELLITNYLDFFDYKSNIKKLAECSWLSADIIQEFLEKGEKFGK